MDAENVEDKPVFRGVVYNEMKGVYSSPDSRSCGAKPAGHVPGQPLRPLIPAAIRKISPT